MYTISCHSDKRDGILFIAKDADNHDDAVKALLAVMNAETETVKIVKDDEDNTYLLSADSDLDVNELEGEAPRWQGWIVYSSPVDENGFAEATW